MKRITLVTLKVLLFAVCFAAAFWHFLSWQAMGNFLVSGASSYASRNGMRLNFSTVSSNADNSGFTIHNFSVNGAVNFTFASLTITPRIAASVLNLALVADLSFTDANARFGQALNLGSGRMTVFVRPGMIHAENIRTNGDFSVNGTITVDTNAARISRASARLNMPPDWEDNISLLRNFLPIEHDGQNWYLRR